MIVGVDHIAILVSSIEEAKNLYNNNLGLKVSETRVSPSGLTKVAWVDVGNTKLELMEPITSDSELAKSLATRGESINHIGLEVMGIESEVDRLKNKGLPFVNEIPRKASSGKVVMLDAKGTKGIRIELVEHY